MKTCALECAPWVEFSVNLSGDWDFNLKRGWCWSAQPFLCGWRLAVIVEHKIAEAVN